MAVMSTGLIGAMQLSEMMASARKHRWWWALLVVVVAGYAIGKDMALRDNRAAASATGAH